MSILICPVCGKKLFFQDDQATCPGGHSFDRARQGYYNLLQSQISSAKRHGDDRLMVESRSDFLNNGYYEPLRQAVCKVICEQANEQNKVLDIGCGEGYYTEKISQTLTASGKQSDITAIDISKDAAKLCAKRPFPHTTIVASAANLPVANHSADFVINIFAPMFPNEIARVMKKSGLFIHVVPLERHLIGLKNAIYEKPYLNPEETGALDGFELIERENVCWELQLRVNKDIRALFAMTPYYYKTSREDQEKINEINELITPLEFGILVYKKTTH